MILTICIILVIFLIIYLLYFDLLICAKNEENEIKENFAERINVLNQFYNEDSNDYKEVFSWFEIPPQLFRETEAPTPSKKPIKKNTTRPAKKTKPPKPTEPGEEPIDCAYSWSKWNYCDFTTNKLTRTMKTVPPSFYGEQCTEPPDNNTKRDCLLNGDFHDKMINRSIPGWDIVYYPPTLNLPNQVIVSIVDQNKINGNEFTKSDKFDTSFVTVQYIIQNPPEISPYNISLPSVTLQTTTMLSPGYYLLDYYVQSRNVETDNQMITVSAKVNATQNDNPFIFKGYAPKGLWVHQVLPFLITNKDIETDEPITISFVFTLYDNKSIIDNTVALGGIKLISCGLQPCVVNCENLWTEWSECNTDGQKSRAPIITVKSQNGSTCPTVDISTCDFDCSYTWSNWGDCSINGFMERVPIIKYPNKNNGKVCPANDISICPVDCQYKWDFWSTTCDAESGTVFRDPSVNILPKNGGMTCPPRELSGCTVDCSYSWNNSDWSQCVEGSTTQTRYARTIPPKNGGEACEQKVETRDSMCATDCKYSWNDDDWSPCIDGSTKQTRNPRTIPPTNGGVECTPGVQTRNSYCPLNCQYSWYDDDWSSCIAGSTEQTRNPRTIAPVNGGTVCTPGIQTRNNYCPVNCQYIWGDTKVDGYDWSSCVNGSAEQTRIPRTIPPINGGNECTPGVQTRSSYCPVDCTYKIEDDVCDSNYNYGRNSNYGTMKKKITRLTKETNGGTCPYDFSKSSTITVSSDTKCSLDCVLTDWTETNDCDLGKPTTTRNRYIKSPGINDGISCNSLALTDTYECSQRCIGQWGEWSQCDPTTSTQTRKYIKTSGDSTYCPKDESRYCDYKSKIYGKSTLLNDSTTVENVGTCVNSFVTGFGGKYGAANLRSLNTLYARCGNNSYTSTFGVTNTGGTDIDGGSLCTNGVKGVNIKYGTDKALGSIRPICTDDTYGEIFGIDYNDNTADGCCNDQELRCPEGLIVDRFYTHTSPNLPNNQIYTFGIGCRIPP